MTIDPSTATKKSTATADDAMFVVTLEDRETSLFITGKLLNERISATKRLTKPFGPNDRGIEVYTTSPGVSAPQKGDFHFWVEESVAIYLTFDLNLN